MEIEFHGAFKNVYFNRPLQLKNKTMSQEPRL